MNMKTLLFATLVSSTAMAPVAMAQTNAPATNEANNQQQACQDLSRIAQENRDTFQREWIDAANMAVRRADAQECAMYVESAEDALVSNQTAEAGSRIVVEQPEPRVSVQQDAPDISVSQGQPQVSVNQGEPEIIVRQAQPTVRIDMPQPTVTIDQPEPEIIVRMPEPDVNVATPEPEVEVSQNEPEVSVQQDQPQIDVQVEEPEVAVESNDRAQVEVDREQPVVRREQNAGEAQVNVERAEPRVSYERAEPNVEVNQAGEPRVQFSESGETNIRFEDRGEASGAANRSEGQVPQQQNAAADTDDEYTRLSDLQEGEEGSDTTASINRERTPEEGAASLQGDSGQSTAGQMAAVEVGAIVGRDVQNGRGEELGQVSRVVTDGTDIYAVLANGGFLGLGEREVALPLDRMSMQEGQDHLLLRGMTEEEIENMPRFDTGAAQELQSSQQIEISGL